MQKKYNVSLFIFRRDLRLEDNSGLLKACKESQTVIPCFILDPAQVSASNKYRSMNAILFMIESLKDLGKQLKQHTGQLYIFYGKPDQIVKELIKENKVNAVFVNQDYTPFSTQRDAKIAKVCTTHKIHFEQCADILLHQPPEIYSLKKTPYFIFTPFFKRAVLLNVSSPVHFTMTKFFTKKIATAHNATIFTKILEGYTNNNRYTHGGSSVGQDILKKIKGFKDYRHDHDYPSIATTYLSAHLKFGTVSVRQTYQAIKNALGIAHPLIRQLYWRDFFTHTAYHRPEMFGHSLKKQYQNLTWKNDSTLFKKWCTGMTGFPIVDAGMRQLNTTGFMHNRVRMIVASFLIKDLHIDWQWGERYFAQQLTDYDPAVNNGNWQWCASTGLDAQPYFRIFNPWLQQKKFDKECIYIKEWIPELKTISPTIIHSLYKSDSLPIKNYPSPIVDHTQESKLAKTQYKKAH